MKRTLAVVLGLCVFAFLSSSLRAENRQFLLYEDFTDFLTAAIPPDWAVEDANADGYTWEAVEWGGVRGGPAARYFSNPDAAADDWLIPPALPLESGVDYTVDLHARVTDSDKPHLLQIVVGTSPGTGDTVLDLPPIASTTPTRYTDNLSGVVPGEYYVQFRTVTPADRLALYLSRIIVSEPEENLEVVLQLDADVYEPDDPNVFAAGDEIPLLVFVRNNGPDPVTLNGRLDVADENDISAVLAYRITGPDGSLVPFEGRIAAPLRRPRDFKETPSGEFVFKFDNLNAGFFDLSAPGDYSVQAVYTNIHQPETGTAWRGVLVSEPSTFTIE